MRKYWIPGEASQAARRLGRQSESEVLIPCVLIGASQAGAKDKIRIITTLPDLASLAGAVGGERVEATALAKGTQDPHNIEVLPSYMIKLRRAHLFLMVGMDLDLWAFPLRDGSRNAKLVVVDCSENIQRLEIPAFNINPSHGDIHIYGNPHYWLDPENGAIIMKTDKTKKSGSFVSDTYLPGLVQVLGLVAMTAAVAGLSSLVSFVAGNQPEALNPGTHQHPVVQEMLLADAGEQILNDDMRFELVVPYP